MNIKPPGPMGHKLRLRFSVPAEKVTRDQIECVPSLSFIGTSTDGLSLIADWHFRSMKRGDDETLVYDLREMLDRWFGISEGWHIDWQNSIY